MNNIWKIVMVAGVVFLGYSIFATIFHVPLFGSYLLIPLLLCGAMHLFMNHGEKHEHSTSNKK